MKIAWDRTINCYFFLTYFTSNNRPICRVKIMAFFLQNRTENSKYNILKSESLNLEMDLSTTGIHLVFRFQTTL